MSKRYDIATGVNKTERDIPEWAMSLADYFGLHLTDADIRRWWSELVDGQDGIRELSYHEASSAIRNQAMRREKGKYDSKPTLRDLRIWILSNRKFKGNASETKSQQFISRMQAKMLSAKDHETRWEIMCGPENYGMERTSTADECQIVENWAVNQWPDFGRPAWMKEAGKQLAEIIAGIQIRQDDIRDDFADIPF